MSTAVATKIEIIPSNRGLRYFDALTGVRAAMMYLVFLCHFNFIRADVHGDLLYRFSREFHVGVPVFYVLSGFLIYYRYGRQLTNFSWRWAGEYLQNRVARIYPVYVLALSYTYLRRGLPRSGGKIDVGETLATYTLTQAWFPSCVHKGISQAWTLTIEEAFYFLAPLLFLVCHLLLRVGARRVAEGGEERRMRYLAEGLSVAAMCLLVAAAGIMLVGLYTAFLGNSGRAVSHVYGRTLCGTIACFGAGIYLARLVMRYGDDLPEGRTPYWTYIGSTCAILTVFATSRLSYLVDPAWIGPGKEPRGVDHPLGAFLVFWVFPVFVAASMWGLITERSALRRVLGSPLLVLLGGSSYVFYLIHLGVVHDQIRAVVTDNYVARFLLLNLIAVTGFVLVEKPANEFLKQMGRGGPRVRREGFPEMMRASLSWPVYLVIAGLVLLAELLPLVLASRITPREANRWLMTEDGVYESLDALICLAGVVAFGWLAIRMRPSSVQGDDASVPNPRFARVWFGLMALMCFFMLGEEISWGQRLLHYNTPEWITRRNTQGEFTIHNMRWFQPEETNNYLQVFWYLAMMLYLAILPWAKFLFPPVRRFLDRVGLPVPGWPIAVICLGWLFIDASAGYFSSEVMELVIISLFVTVAAESFFVYREWLAPFEGRKLAVTMGVTMAVGLVLSLVQAGEVELPSVRSMALWKEAHPVIDEAKKRFDLGRTQEAVALLSEPQKQLEDALRVWPNNFRAHIDLGRILIMQGDLDQGIMNLEAGLKIEPKDLEARDDLAMAYYRKKRTADAIPILEGTLRMAPERASALNHLAWVLATTPHDDLRNGRRALQLAEAACATNKPARSLHLDTLAAAQAEIGDFESAARTAQMAIDAAHRENTIDVAARIQDRLWLYKSGKPYRAGS